MSELDANLSLTLIKSARIQVHILSPNVTNDLNLADIRQRNRHADLKDDAIVELLAYFVLHFLVLAGVR